MPRKHFFLFLENRGFGAKAGSISDLIQDSPLHLQLTGPQRWK